VTPAGLLFLVAVVISLLATLGAERLARRFDIVSRPTADRWHRMTIPLLGGISIIAGSLSSLAMTRTRPEFVVLSFAGLAIALVGFVDDVRKLSPQVKLLAQILVETAAPQPGTDERPQAVECAHRAYVVRSTARIAPESRSQPATSCSSRRRPAFVSR